MSALLYQSVHALNIRLLSSRRPPEKRFPIPIVGYWFISGCECSCNPRFTPNFPHSKSSFIGFAPNTKLWKLVRFRENQISVDFHQFYIPLDKKDTARGIGKVPIFVAFIDENVWWSGRGLCGIYHWIASSISAPHLCCILHLSPDTPGAWSLEQHRDSSFRTSHHQQSSIRCRGGDCIHSAMLIIWYHINH